MVAGRPIPARTHRNRISSTPVEAVTVISTICTSAQNPIPAAYAQRLPHRRDAHAHRGRARIAVPKIAAMIKSLSDSRCAQYLMKKSSVAWTISTATFVNRKMKHPVDAVGQSRPMRFLDAGSLHRRNCAAAKPRFRTLTIE
jgi:hypothetical protein